MSEELLPRSQIAADLLAGIVKIAEEASALRRLCVGSPMEIERLARHSIDGDSKADFDGLVTILYLVWCESWKQDVAFFSQHPTGMPVNEFSQLIGDLRTAAQHTDNSRVQVFYRRWTEANGGTPIDWQECMVALLEAAVKGIRGLAASMAKARSDPRAIERWRQSETLSSRSSVTAVAQDLGLTLSPGLLQRHSRDVEKRLKHQPPRIKDDPQATVDSYAMQQLISLGWSRPVCVDYYFLLEEFDLVAHPDACDLLRLAHVVERVTRTATRREEFLAILKQSWRFLTKQRR